MTDTAHMHITIIAPGRFPEDLPRMKTIVTLPGSLIDVRDVIPQLNKAFERFREEQKILLPLIQPISMTVYVHPEGTA